MTKRDDAGNGRSPVDTVEELRAALEECRERYRLLEDSFNMGGGPLIERRVREEVKNVSSELAHDLRGTLQTIRNCVYLLKMDPDDDSPLEQMDNAIMKAATMLDDFREYYKGDEIKTADANINSIVEHALIEAEVPRGLKVKASLSPDVEKITVDPNKMKRVFYHLIREAVDAMPSGGSLSIETRDTPNAVEVDISDTGEPIPEELRGDLFKPYGSKSRDGNGLSLPSCRKVVRAHGGELTFRAGEEGNTFTVCLPKACG